jgi:putative flippase GtrA
MNLQIVFTVLGKMLDSIYPIFRSVLPKSTFRYLACGGSNAILDFILFYLIYNYILKSLNLQISFWTITPHIASLFFSLIITMPIGYLLSKHIVFRTESKNKEQLLRYIIVVLISMILNYLLMKLFVEKLYFSPILSKISTTLFIIIFNYIGQKKIAFQIP